MSYSYHLLTNLFFFLPPTHEPLRMFLLQFRFQKHNPHKVMLSLEHPSRIHRWMVLTGLLWKPTQGGNNVRKIRNFQFIRIGVLLIHYYLVGCSCMLSYKLDWFRRHCKEKASNIDVLGLLNCPTWLINISNLVLVLTL